MQNLCCTADAGRNMQVRSAECGYDNAVAAAHNRCKDTQRLPNCMAYMSGFLLFSFNVEDAVAADSHGRTVAKQGTALPAAAATCPSWRNYSTTAGFASICHAAAAASCSLRCLRVCHHHTATSCSNRSEDLTQLR
jgi:hypothetical protein